MSMESPKSCRLRDFDGLALFRFRAPVTRNSIPDVAGLGLE
jgi:hypothetical protein